MGRVRVVVGDRVRVGVWYVAPDGMLWKHDILLQHGIFFAIHSNFYPRAIEWGIEFEYNAILPTETNRIDLLVTTRSSWVGEPLRLS